MAEKSMYEKLGVDPDKRSVREIFGQIVRNDFPGAFVNIVRGEHSLSGKVSAKHADGDGSKFVQRLLHYFETGDEQIFQGAVDDAFSMNSGDIAASGFVSGRWVITQTININALNVRKDLIMKQIALRVESLLKLYEHYGFKPVFLGGETADLPDQVKSVVYDVDIFAEGYEWDMVRGNVQPGDQIHGFASDGQAVWEQTPNSGIMSNGLTLARTCLMQEGYGKNYPFLIRDNGKYQGRFTVTHKPEELGGMTVSQAMLAPTRQWAILIRLLIEKLKQENIFQMLHGISLNTGGGATKIRHLGQGILYLKNMPDPPPFFRLVQAESGESWRNMYKSFNCGVGLDVVGENNPRFVATLKFISRTTGVELFHLGVCSGAASKKNQVALRTPFGDFDDY